MDRCDLQRVFDEAGISPDTYSLDGGLPNDALCLAHHGGKWEVYYSERGTKNLVAVWDTETEACQDLYERIIGD